MQAFTIGKKDHGKRCDKFLFENLTCSPSEVFKSFRKRSVKVNGKRVQQDYPLSEGDHLEIYIPEAYLAGADTEEPPSFSIVYEDEFILAVSKPQGVQAMDEDNDDTGTLEKKVGIHLSNRGGTRLKQGFPALCHRLDRNTGGLVLFAKDAKTLDIMKDKFKHHELSKYYQAVVYGVPRNAEANLSAYLEKDSGKSRVYIHEQPVKGAERILTNYKVLRKMAPYALLEIQLVTGKTHQIRAHMAFIGHPLLGDGKYGINSVNRFLKLKRQALWATRIEFHFKRPSEHLAYLNGKDIILPDILWDEGIRHILK